jgi:hypothetical protein
MGHGAWQNKQLSCLQKRTLRNNPLKIALRRLSSVCSLGFNINATTRQSRLSTPLDNERRSTCTSGRGSIFYFFGALLVAKACGEDWKADEAQTDELQEKELR